MIPGALHLPTPDGVQVLLTLSGVAGLWLGWAKVLGPRLARGWSRFVGIFQAIAGRDAIVDKVSGREVSPAVPPLGEQLTSIHDTMAKLVAVVESNHDAHKRIDRHESVLASHDQAIGALIAGSNERAATALASAALINAVTNKDLIVGETDD